MINVCTNIDFPRNKLCFYYKLYKGYKGFCVNLNFLIESSVLYIAEIEQLDPVRCCDYNCIFLLCNQSMITPPRY